MALSDLFTSIADAIRAKEGTTDSIVANNFPERIRAIETGFKISLSVDPPGTGIVSGSGRASSGMNVTVTETEDFENGYGFVSWEENGQTVSTEKKYSFIVDRNRSLTAITEQYDFWFRPATMPFSAVFRSVTYGGGKFVAVSYNSNRAVYSTDGISWTATTLPLSANWRGVTYGDGKFVAVAYSSNKAAYSEDGITWTAATLPFNAYWNSVTYGDGKFVAVCGTSNSESNKSAYSEDGVTWETISMPSSSAWAGVTYGDGKFVAVVGATGNDKLAYSAKRSQYVLVVWDDDGYEDVRPESVTVDLLRDGDLYDSKVLSAATNWSAQWDGLSSQHVWFISATDFPEYLQTIDMEANTFVVTYTYDLDPTDPEQPPII